MTSTPVDPDSPLYNRAHEALTAALNHDQGAVLRNCWHDQARCPGCGLWAIWTPKETP